MRIDAHQHFWRYSAEDYGWIGPEMAILRKDHLPADLDPLLLSTGFSGTVAVQARQTLAETAWLLELASQASFIAGVVGWVDLRSRHLRDQLERFCRHPKFRGVRHVLQDEPDDQFMVRDRFQNGLASLRDFGLTYDILIFPRHLHIACQMVSRFPDQPFVLDHLAKPPIKDGLLEPWAKEIRRLGGFSNVFCKVSGMVTEASWQHWSPADFQPYLDVVFEAFGPQRIMFGSDWPVCTVAGSYGEVAAIVAAYIGHLSKDEQSAVWGDTAAQFYGLELHSAITEDTGRY